MICITILGLIAAGLTTFSFLPQAIKTIKTKHTKDLSLSMYVIATIGVFLWLIYGLILKNPPLIIGNAITFVLTAIILFLKIKHG